MVLDVMKEPYGAAKDSPMTVAGNFQRSAGFKMRPKIHRPIHREAIMQIIRRDLLGFSAAAVAIPAISQIAFAQAPQAGPKLTQILRKDLESQGQVVQETVVSLVEFGPGSAAPWHMHPGAQELLQVIEGNLTVEIEGKDTTVLKTGEAGIIAAEVVHLARNESTSTSAKAFVVHSRAAKDKPLIVVVKK
jgi:quercetin dioxygenase-like cupin family protein